MSFAGQSAAGERRCPPSTCSERSFNVLNAYDIMCYKRVYPTNGLQELQVTYNHKESHWAGYKGTSRKSAYRHFKKVKNQCTEAIREGGLQYQIKIIDKYISDPKSSLRHTDFLRQAETGVSHLLEPNGSTSNDGFAVDLVEQYLQRLNRSMLNTSTRAPLATQQDSQK